MNLRLDLGSLALIQFAQVQIGEGRRQAARSAWRRHRRQVFLHVVRIACSVWKHGYDGEGEMR